MKPLTEGSFQLQGAMMLPSPDHSVGRKPGLLDQAHHAPRTKHYAHDTENAYLAWTHRFIVFHHKHHPEETGAREVNQFLSHLAVKGNVAALTQNQALCALIFLYKEVLERDLGDSPIKRCKNWG